MFKSQSNIKDKDDFLKQTQDARNKRQEEKRIEKSVLVIQRTYRGFIIRKRYFTQLM
jgi:flagellar hook-length control protein FliK